MSRLAYGGYFHAEGDAAVEIRTAVRYSPRGFIETVGYTASIRGVLHGADASAINAQVALLEAAYGLQGQDLILYDSQGGIAHQLISATALGGTRVISGPEYPVGTGAEGGTFRTYAISVTADYPNTGQNLLDFVDELDLEGTGGPAYVFQEVLEELPQVQIGRQFTVCRGRQTGRAVGLFAYPPPAPPVFPLAILPNRTRIKRRNPRRQAAYLRDWVVEWSYEFASTEPLAGYPNIL